MAALRYIKSTLWLT